MLRVHHGSEEVPTVRTSVRKEVKPFLVLRGHLTRLDIDYAELADMIGRSPSYVARRMINDRAWDQDDQEKIMDIIGADWKDLPVIFPRRRVS